MGRQPTPPELARRRGNPGKRALPAPQVLLPSAVDNVPPMPEGLGEAGERYWADVWRAAASWLNPGMNGAQVEDVCRRYDEMGRYREALRSGPLLRVPKVAATGKQVVDPTTGQPVYEFVENPAEKMLRRAERQQLADLVALGIPPTARAKLGLVQVKATSALEEMLRRRTTPVPVIDVDAEEW